MRRKHFVCLSLAGLAAALLAAGCGGSGSVTGPEGEPPVAGQAVVQGTVVGATAGLQVGVVGTPLVAPVDEEGQFALAGVPPGTATLRFEGAGVDARLPVPGLQDGQVTSITVQLSGGAAQLAGAPSCSPTAETHFSGTLDRIEGSQLVVAGRTVDASQVQKVWRGDRRIQLADLQAGEKVKVWGTLRGDGVVLAVEILALTTGPGPGGWTWVALSGVVESVHSSALDLHSNPNPPYPSFVVKGTTVLTDSGTRVKRSDGSPMSASEIRAGQRVSVEGWKRTDGVVKADKVVVEGAGTSESWVAFRGKVDSVAFDALDVHGNPNGGAYPKLSVAGRYVKTDGGTRFKWSDGTALDAHAIRAGDQAYVEGFTKPDGYVLAAKVIVDCR
jgi:hypothetical protein